MKPHRKDIWALCHLRAIHSENPVKAPWTHNVSTSASPKFLDVCFMCLNATPTTRPSCDTLLRLKNGRADSSEQISSSRPALRFAENDRDTINDETCELIEPYLRFDPDPNKSWGPWKHAAPWQRKSRRARIPLDINEKNTCSTCVEPFDTCCFLREKWRPMGQEMTGMYSI